MGIPINAIQEAGFFISAFQKYEFEPEKDFYNELKKCIANEVPFIIVVLDRKVTLRSSDCIRSLREIEKKEVINNG